MSFPKRTSLVALIVPLFLIVTGCELLNLGAKPPLCEDSSVQNYVATIDDNAEQIGSALIRIGELGSRLQNDPSLIDTEAWKSAMSDEVAKIFIISDETQRLSAPRKELEIFHVLITGAFEDYKQGTTLLEESLAEEDSEKFFDARDILLRGDQKVQGALDELDSILDDCSWYTSSF